MIIIIWRWFSYVDIGDNIWVAKIPVLSALLSAHVIDHN